ncbi:MAG: SMC-Scp complex subunit ScpB [Christensenellales bacterium]
MIGRMRLLRFGQHVQLATRPDYAKYVEKLLQPVQKQSLSQAVMETLAVIAYRQPVTKAEIELIRGVKCDYSVQTLVTRGLIAEVGRKDALGRPILYGTTDAFLRHFCLNSLADLPEIDFSWRLPTALRRRKPSRKRRSRTPTLWKSSRRTSPRKKKAEG